MLSGLWFLVAPGSGIWLDLGRSVFEGDAPWAHDVKRDRELADLARRAGFDTVFRPYTFDHLSPHDMRSYGRVEVIDARVGHLTGDADRCRQCRQNRSLKDPGDASHQRHAFIRKCLGSCSVHTGPCGAGVSGHPFLSIGYPGVHLRPCACDQTQMHLNCGRSIDAIHLVSMRSSPGAVRVHKQRVASDMESLQAPQRPCGSPPSEPEMPFLPPLEWWRLSEAGRVGCVANATNATSAWSDWAKLTWIGRPLLVAPRSPVLQCSALPPPLMKVGRAAVPSPVTPAADSELNSSDAELLREYLSAVYPVGGFTNASACDLAFLFHTRVWVYQHAISSLSTTLLLRRLLCGHRGSKSSISRTCEQSGLLRVDDRRMYHGLLPCFQGCNCARRQGAYHPDWAADVEQRPNEAFLEVFHMAYSNWINQKSARARPQDWADFMDSPCRYGKCQPLGTVGTWYVLAPGSGIFYQAGRTAVAPTKVAMLSRLLGEWLANASIPHDRVPPFGKLKWAGPEVMLRALRSVANGSQTCSEAGVPLCYDSKTAHGVAGAASYTIMDHYDFSMIDMARALSYDTLLFTASFLRADLPPGASTGSQKQLRSAGAELVDVRLPQSDHKRRWATLNRNQQAEAWVSEWQASERLTLRDPLNPAGSGSRPCAFNATPTRLLACDGHISWSQRNTVPASWVECACPKPT